MLLNGEEPKITYADLHQILNGIQNCISLEPEGAYRYWKHPKHPEFLQVRDNGQGAMYPRFVRRAGAWLRALEQNGGLNEQRTEAGDG